MGHRSAIFCVLAVLVAASPAFAIDFADGASVNSSSKASITNLSDAANGTSETDDKRATIAQSGNGSGHVEIQFDFPSMTIPSGDDAFFLVVDGSVSGTIGARIWEINGSTLRGTSVDVTGSGLSDKYFALPYSLSTQTTVTSITIRFSLSSGDSMQLDAVATPEPSTYALFGIGAIVVGLAVRRSRRKHRESFSVGQVAASGPRFVRK